MFSQILEVTLPVFGIAALGYLYGRIHGGDMDTANRVNMNRFVPALLFYVLSEKIPDSPEWQSVAWGTGILAYIGDWQTPPILMPGLEMLSEVAIPLRLVALGVRLIHVDPTHWRAGLLGALLCPATGLASAWLAILCLQPSEAMQRILLLFSLLPPAVLNFLLAERYRQSPAEVASMVAFGNLGSLVVIPLALAFLL